MNTKTYLAIAMVASISTVSFAASADNIVTCSNFGPCAFNVDSGIDIQTVTDNQTGVANNATAIGVNASNITTGDAATLSSANTYTDQREQVLRDEAQVIIDQAVVLGNQAIAAQAITDGAQDTAITTGDTNTLNNANTYTDSTATTLRAEGQAVITQAIAIGNAALANQALTDGAQDATITANRNESVTNDRVVAGISAAADAAQDTAVAESQAVQDDAIAENTTVNDAQEVSINNNTAALSSRGIVDDQQNATLANHENRITANSDAINGLNGDVRDLRGGVAAAIAIGAHQFDYKYQGLQGSLSAGYYDGEQAGSVAFGGNVGHNTFVNVSVSQTTRGNTGAGAAVGFHF